MMGRKLSVEHEEAWLTLAGFLLRPGFGFAHDGLRMDELWRLRDAGLCFPGKRSKVQEYILWRRVAGGLTAERQERLLAGELASIRAGKAPPELVRLTIEDLQADLDLWMREFNEVRPHQGKWCFGETPLQTFLDALPIAREKSIQITDGDQPPRRMTETGQPIPSVRSNRNFYNLQLRAENGLRSKPQEGCCHVAVNAVRCAI